MTTDAVKKCPRYTWIASIVTEEGGEARTINLCGPCYSEKPVQQGKQPLKVAEWREIIKRKAHRGRLWEIGSELFLRGMLEYVTIKRAWARKVLADAAQENKKEYKIGVACENSLELPIALAMLSQEMHEVW